MIPRCLPSPREGRPINWMAGVTMCSDARGVQDLAAVPEEEDVGRVGRLEPVTPTRRLKREP